MTEMLIFCVGCMSTLLLNRDGGFVMPADGWYQLAPLGEFAHAQAGVVQVVDQAACEAMAGRFVEEARTANFAGILIDFDHFSLDGEKRSEAAGWITALEARGPGDGGQETVATADSADERRGENAQRATLNDGWPDFAPGWSYVTAKSR